MKRQLVIAWVKDDGTGSDHAIRTNYIGSHNELEDLCYEVHDLIGQLLDDDEDPAGLDHIERANLAEMLAATGDAYDQVSTRRKDRA